MEIVIWWVDEKDCHSIGEHLPENFPKYLREEYRRRYGRGARGRLWTAPQFGEVEVKPWPDSPLARCLGIDHGGIVMKQRDVGYLQHYPGVLTDTRLVRVDISVFA